MSDYTREEVQSIFSPGTTFTPQAGTWGLQGIVRVPDREGDWVYFVTFGQQQGDHAFDESITDEGVLSWQSQPSQRLDDKLIRSLIERDERVNTIHLFLRTTRRAKYTYLGKLGYLTHDKNREADVLLLKLASVGNLRDTSHFPEPTPRATLADKPKSQAN